MKTRDLFRYSTMAAFLAASYSLNAAAQPVTIFSDDLDTGYGSEWVELLKAVSWGGNPTGTSGIQTKTVQGVTGITVTEAVKAAQGFALGTTSMFQALDYQFAMPIDRSSGDTTITINFRAIWDSGSLSNEGSRFVVTYVHDYPEDGLDINSPSRTTDPNSAWWGRPAYNMRIRTLNQQAMIMYGGGPEPEGEFEFVNGVWLPGFSSAPGGDSPQPNVPGVEGAGLNRYSQSAWKDYSYVLKPDRQELWYDGDLVGTQMLGDITDPGEQFDANGLVKQFDTIEGIRLFWRATNTAQAIISDVEILVDSPSLFQNLFWDPDQQGPSNLGGDGAWTASGQTFFNGFNHMSLSDSPSRNAIFTGGNGTVTIQADLTLGQVVIRDAAYVFEVPASRQVQADLLIEADAHWSRTGAGALTIIGDLINDGELHLGGEPTMRIAVQGDLHLGEGSTLRIELANPDAHQAPITMTGAAMVDGELLIQTSPGFDALPGDRFDVIAATSTVGSFATVLGDEPGVGGLAGLWLELEDHGSTIELVARALIGDANLDGVVDDLDLAILQASLGQVNGKTWRDGDFTGGGRVGLRDAFLLFEGFGDSISPPTLVPEPSTAASLGLAILALGRRRRG
ncbi:MAG: PEP-CTERM sorting domain-containing protein [Phycisphaeraceae bacterium]|nr:PEP-CTERM sorting domain-containing protein [Phycisphaeraceae bacterium]